jgi:hypothetical protein
MCLPRDEMHSMIAGMSVSFWSDSMRRRRRAVRLEIISDVDKLTRGTGQLKTVVAIAANAVCIGVATEMPSSALQRRSMSQVGTANRY